MTPELILFLVAAVIALELVALVARRGVRDELARFALLGGVLTVLAYVHGTRRYESRAAFVAEALGLVLTFLPRLIDGLEAQALARERFATALKIARLREALLPGRAAHRRRRQLEDLHDVVAGHAETALSRLRAEIAQAEEPGEAARLHEELVLALLLERRSAEAIDHYERHLGSGWAGERPRFAVHVLRAYGELGRLSAAAETLASLERAASRDPTAALVALEGRLWLLAYAGRADDVEALLETLKRPALSPRAKEGLRAVARARAGTLAPPEVAALGQAMRARAQAARTPPRITIALIVLNVNALALASGLAKDESGASLIRLGALFRPAVLGGEWWRAVTAMFLHADWLHLALNMYGLWLLGRLDEELFGASRYFLVYAFGGLCGAAASTLLGAGALSVGASGAIMGLLGALIVMLIVRRGAWPEAWRRTLLVNLLLLGALQIYIGFQVPMIDNAAHVGGALGGAAAALVLAPGGLVPTGPRARVIVRGLAIAVALAMAGAAVQVARTPLSRTLERVPARAVELGGVRVEVPSHWELDVEHGKAEDPYLGIKLTAQMAGGAPRLDFAGADDARFAEMLARIRKSAAPASKGH